MAAGSTRGLTGDYYSPSRFVRTAYLNVHYSQRATEGESVSRLLHTLARAAMTPLASPDAEAFGVPPLAYAQDLAGERLSTIC